MSVSVEGSVTLASESGESLAVGKEGAAAAVGNKASFSSTMTNAMLSGGLAWLVMAGE